MATCSAWNSGEVSPKNPFIKPNLQRRRTASSMDIFNIFVEVYRWSSSVSALRIDKGDGTPCFDLFSGLGEHLECNFLSDTDLFRQLSGSSLENCSLISSRGEVKGSFHRLEVKG